MLSIPFCFMSAFADEAETSRRGWASGATHYFTKPLDYGELEELDHRPPAELRACGRRDRMERIVTPDSRSV